MGLGFLFGILAEEIPARRVWYGGVALVVTGVRSELLGAFGWLGGKIVDGRDLTPPHTPTHPPNFFVCRRERNKMHAKATRERKKAYLDAMEKVRGCVCAGLLVLCLWGEWNGNGGKVFGSLNYQFALSDVRRQSPSSTTRTAGSQKC